MLYSHFSESSFSTLIVSIKVSSGYVIRDARKWEVAPERTASRFAAVYHRGLLEKAWGEAAFVLDETSKNVS